MIASVQLGVFRQMFRFAALATFFVGAVLVSLFFQRPAHADCQVSGANVLCSGIDPDGFILRAPNLNFTVPDTAVVYNVDTGVTNGACPLSFPAVALGTNATALNQGTITASGVCGWALEAGSHSKVTNTGGILAVGNLGFGIVGDDDVAVTSTLQIRTFGDLGTGVLLGNGAVVNNSGVIATSGINAPGIDVLDKSAVTNTGTISASGNLSDGIKATSESTIVNKATILVSGQHAAGVRMSGSILTLNNSGSISAIAETASFIPEAGVVMQGEKVDAINSGNIVASDVGVKLSATGALSFSNSGAVIARGEGTATGNAAVLVTVPNGKTAFVTNAGTIDGLGGSAAIRVAGGNLYLTNAGTITGDLLMGAGDDTLEMQAGTFELMDGGAGNDTLVLGNTGPLDGLHATTRNVETLRVFTTGAWRLSGTTALSASAGIALGTLVVNGTLTAPQVDVAQGAFLRGSGTVTGAVANRGVLYPGDGALASVNPATQFDRSYAAPARLTIVGSYTQFITGTLYLRLNYNQASDQVAVIGPASLNGKLHLQVGRNGGVDGQGAYTLLTASGGVTGTFAIVETNSFFLKATLSQSSTALSAQVTRASYASVAWTNAQRQAGLFFDRHPDLAPLALDNVATANDARRILNQVAPDVFPALQNAGLFTLAMLREAARGKTRPADESWQAWGAYGLHGGDEPVSGQSYVIHGGIAGIGKTWPDGTAIGFQIAHTSAADTFTGIPDRADFGAAFGGVTAAHTWGRVRLESGLLYGGGNAAVQRTITLNGTAQTLSSAPSVNMLSFYANITTNHMMGPLVVTPRFGAAFDRVEIGDIDEQTAGSLRTADSSVQSFRSEIGVRAAMIAGRIKPYGGVTASWDFLGEPRMIPVFLNGSSAGFTLKGPHPERFILDIEGGLTFALAQNLTGTVGGRIAANDRFAGHSVVARLLWLW